MKTKMKWIGGAGILAMALCSLPAMARDLVGVYENRSESAFSYTLQLQKDGKAVYREPDPDTGKVFALRGTWSIDGTALVADFGAKGKYRYAISEELTWASFGCKGASFGLANKGTPRSAQPSLAHDLWIKSDLRKADACQPI